MEIKCLIIDDEVLAQNVIENYISTIPTLKLVGKCDNAIEAISFLHNNPVDLLFLDLNMPKKTGFECLKEIRSINEWKYIKIVILTTSSHQDQINEVYKMGADLYLQKPTSYTAYKDILTKCLHMDWDSLK